MLPSDPEVRARGPWEVLGSREAQQLLGADGAPRLLEGLEAAPRGSGTAWSVRALTSTGKG